jgi:hypothetical protein
VLQIAWALQLCSWAWFQSSRTSDFNGINCASLRPACRQYLQVVLLWIVVAVLSLWALVLVARALFAGDAVGTRELGLLVCTVLPMLLLPLILLEPYSRWVVQQFEQACWSQSRCPDCGYALTEQCCNECGRCRRSTIK